MTDTLESLHREMAAAADALDFERARRLRDRIALLRAGADDTAVDTSGLTRQQPGAMGLGTSRQQVVPPPGWVKPAKPDPMTKRKR